MRGKLIKLDATPATELERRRSSKDRTDETGRSRAMILATTKVEDVDRFLEVFSTKGAEKRQQHGSKGSTVYRDPNEENRVWVLFDWDGEGWQSFVSDPEVPAILQAAGHVGKPQAGEIVGQYNA
jgi:quinol monooxygenase YgiN